jgi:tRNA threonylcarbamoyladenosine biosynthesis protein TsaE
MPILSPHALEFISRSAGQTRRMGMRLGELLQRGDVVGLCGELGTGKTTFVQGLASGWGSTDAVTSPTFVLVNVYRRSDGLDDLGVLYHLDAYRLMGTAEQILTQAIDLDLETMFATGALVVEWAERVQEILPDERLTVSLSWVDENQRDLMINGSGERGLQLLETLQRHTYGSA